MQLKATIFSYYEKLKNQYNRYKHTSWFKWIIAGLFILCLLGVVDKGYDVVIKNKLDSINQTYISEEIKEVRQVFIVLSEIEAGLAILKSAEAGFTFIVELKTQFGNILEPLHKMVNNAWLISFASLCSLGLIEMSYKLADKLGNFFLSSLVLVYLCLLLMGSIKQNVIKSSLVAIQRLLMIIVIVSYVLLPLYLMVSGALLSSFAGPHKEKLVNNIKSHHSGLVIENNEAYKKKANQFSTKLDKQTPEVKKHLNGLAQHLPTHIALHLLLYLLLPILFPIMLYFGTRFAVHHYYREKVTSGNKN